jgi:hypothetical protein
MNTNRVDLRIATAVKQLEDAISNLKEIQSSIEKNCKHEFLIECPYEPLYWFRSLSHRRMCTICRREEEGSSRSSSQYFRAEEGRCELGNSPERTVTMVTRDEFCSYRVPYIPVDRAPRGSLTS